MLFRSHALVYQQRKQHIKKHDSSGAKKQPMKMRAGCLRGISITKAGVSQFRCRKLFCFAFSPENIIYRWIASEILRMLVCLSACNKLPISNAEQLKFGTRRKFLAIGKLQRGLSADFTQESSSYWASDYVILHADSENVQFVRTKT